MPQINDDRQVRREIPISVKEWGGMLSNLPTKVIPANAFSLLLNVDFRGPYKLRTRRGSVQYSSNSVIGSTIKIIAAFEFKKAGDLNSKIVKATSNGKLYYSVKGIGNPDILIGNLSNPLPVQVGMTQMADKLYIADGKSALVWDGSTLVDIKSTFPSISPLTTGNIIDVVATLNQLWWVDSNDYAYASAFNIPDDLTTEAAGAFKIQIQYGDGATVKNMVAWANSILFSKIDENRDHHIMYWLQGIGTTQDPYRVEPLFGDPKSPVAFLGRSAVQVGGDVLGLTLNGVVTFSSINTFQQVRPNSISLSIDDIIQRINFKMTSKIHGIFDTVNRQYMLAVPLDGANKVTNVLVYDVDGDRWSLYDNWGVCCWVRVNTDVLFGTEDGRLVKTRIGDSDEGGGFDKQIVSGDNDYGAPDIVKLFKSVEIDIQHEGDYSVDYIFNVDNIDVNENTPTELKLAGGASLWDEAFWDIDNWDALGNTIRNILLMARGKTLKHKITNSEPNQPFTVESMTTRIMVKDSGQAKTG